jgi:hypothetical protein
MQEQVLRFARSLHHGAPVGVTGASLLEFANTLDPVSAQEMSAAIEKECERVDSGLLKADWSG